MAAELAQLKLTTISLEHTGLTSEALSKLEFADWLTLRHLDLSHNDTDALGMQYLCMVHLPVLRLIVLNRSSVLACSGLLASADRSGFVIQPAGCKGHDILSYWNLA